jgi:Protein of unknown function (DUF3551)
MRTFFLALAASATIFGGSLAHAASEEYRYCLQGEEFAGGGDCSFTGYQQCQAAASGRMATCGANLQYSAVMVTARTRPRHH